MHDAVPPAAQVDAPSAAPPDQRRARLRAEVWIVLGLSVGQSAVYALVRLLDRLTRDVPIGQQVTTLNPSQNERPWLDLIYQLLDVVFTLVPVALALYLLSTPGRAVLRRIGLDLARPWRDLGTGAALAAVVGIPGLGLYVVARALGWSVAIQTSGLDPHWWAVPVLILAALKNALLEEVVAVGYLVERLGELRWGVPAIITASALLRGTYHLYQGPGMAAGNVVMGVLYAWYYVRTRRVAPLVVAHTTLDVVAFLGYTLLPGPVLEALGIT
ncbi:CPBP family intramembrane glutamic endopeptidase [Actinotalea fermentans]|uniref:CAAX amino protease n=1 Tax=Actinotalea fermentans TaxID=43671 RepID=A0A511Z293_9CELL|nr:CAAX protease [Actinotalea fermentans ATCC 43279 = JCM 9966 = DSM 3133]GEN81565.1 CAAX amino protease [Actinotalea fermentans]